MSAITVMLSACAVKLVNAGLIELSTTLLVRQRIDILTGCPIRTAPVAMDPNDGITIRRAIRFELGPHKFDCLLLHERNIDGLSYPLAKGC